MSEDRKGTKKLPIDSAYWHIHPQAPEVEKAILGALMIDKDAYVEVCDLENWPLMEGKSGIKLVIILK